MRTYSLLALTLFGAHLLFAEPSSAQGPDNREHPTHDHSDPPADALFHIEKPFTVRDGKGFVQLHDRGSGLPGVRVEFTDARGHVKKAKTNDNGKFKIHGLADGTYTFMTKGYASRSATGTVIVKHNAVNPDRLIIETELGRYLPSSR